MCYDENNCYNTTGASWSAISDCYDTTGASWSAISDCYDTTGASWSAVSDCYDTTGASWSAISDCYDTTGASWSAISDCYDTTGASWSAISDCYDTTGASWSAISDCYDTTGASWSAVSDCYDTTGASWSAISDCPVLVAFYPESKVEGSAPKFTAKPSIKQVGAGVVFEVRLTADPEPAITWYFGDSVIQDGSHYKISTQADGASYILLLEMATISAADGGSYKVTAKNKLGESNANINLNLGGYDLTTIY